MNLGIVNTYPQKKNVYVFKTLVVIIYDKVIHIYYYNIPIIIQGNISNPQN